MYISGDARTITEIGLKSSSERILPQNTILYVSCGRSGIHLLQDGKRNREDNFCGYRCDAGWPAREYTRGDFHSPLRTLSPSVSPLRVYAWVTRLAQRDQITPVMRAPFTQRLLMMYLFRGNYHSTLEAQLTERMLRSHTCHGSFSTLSRNASLSGDLFHTFHTHCSPCSYAPGSISLPSGWDSPNKRTASSVSSASVHLPSHRKSRCSSSRNGPFIFHFCHLNNIT